MYLLQNTLSYTVMIVNYILLDNVQNQSSEDKVLFLSLICKLKFSKCYSFLITTVLQIKLAYLSNENTS